MHFGQKTLGAFFEGPYVGFPKIPVLELNYAPRRRFIGVKNAFFRVGGMKTYDTKRYENLIYPL